MTNRNQTCYYHIGQQNANDIQVKIKVRKVTSAQTTDGKTRSLIKRRSSHDIKSIISWQQKIQGPFGHINNIGEKTSADSGLKISENRNEATNYGDDGKCKV